jgi:hypothetical protein
VAKLHHPLVSLLAACRFDVRALLDFYKDPDPRVLANQQKSHEELKLEEVCVCVCEGDVAGRGSCTCCVRLFLQLALPFMLLPGNPHKAFQH